MERTSESLVFQETIGSTIAWTLMPDKLRTIFVMCQVRMQGGRRRFGRSGHGQTRIRHIHSN